MLWTLFAPFSFFVLFTAFFEMKFYHLVVMIKYCQWKITKTYPL
jgi:hypothetical protein